ncbi:LamG domain-containing protein [Halorubrum ezzemoulense]|uniref:LamG-like jellyroll fold domain-containing protein n=1 Tax=Halorubrum ezzemoulense TaxID=337243 RepID=A0A256JTR2_HALEZ|nr:LamG domain-containing protein [Halorubrum ezzemoulense]OYR72235.1 hypothetical protein DJ76_12755 [Halorubrum ezzemoulense]
MVDLSDFIAHSPNVKRGNIPAERRRRLNDALERLNSGLYGSDTGQISGGGNDIPTTGLVSYWPLDDLEDGTATDYVGRNAGTVNGSVSTVTGKFDNAAAFDGGYIEVGTGETFGLSEFTVSAWARAEDEDASGLRTILARQDPTGKSYEKRTFVLWFDDDSGFFGAGVISARTAETDRDLRTVTTSDSYIDSEWHHVSVTAVADGELTLYVDGTEQTTESIDGPLYTGSGKTWIGQSPSQVRPLSGAVDDVRIYDRALSGSEITTLYDTTSISK